jgi:hypothetical protein
MIFGIKMIGLVRNSYLVAGFTWLTHIQNLFI